MIPAFISNIFFNLSTNGWKKRGFMRKKRLETARMAAGRAKNAMSVSRPCRAQAGSLIRATLGSPP
mgnify:CR=1 FL=1